MKKRGILRRKTSNTTQARTTTPRSIAVMAVIATATLSPPTVRAQQNTLSQPSSASPATSASTPSSAPLPTTLTPPGALVLGDWRAWYLGTNTDLILVQSAAPSDAVNAIDAPFTEPSILRRYLTFSYKDFLQYGPQPALELALDEACKAYSGSPQTFPTRPIEDVMRELLGERGAEAALKHPDKNTPYFMGAALSRMAKPQKILKASDGSRFTIAAAVASCKEAPGKRYELAQKRAFNTNITNNVRALTWIVQRWIVSSLASAADENAKEAIKARALEISIKAMRLSLGKMNDYQRWLAGPEGKLLGGTSTWNEPLTPAVQSYSRGLESLLEKQLSSLEREYRAGGVRGIKAYPTLNENALIENADLDAFIPQ